MNKTQPIAAEWRIQFPVTKPEPRRRYPRTTASLAVTARIALAGLESR